MTSLNGRSEPPPDRARTIALIDGDGRARAEVSARLRRFGHIVHSFADGEGFLAATLPEAFECIVLDDGLPGKGAARLLAKLRERSHPPALVVTSSSSRWQGAVAAFKAGASDFLVKPFRTDKLLEAIEEACERRRAAQRTFDPKAAAFLASLSLREQQVLHGMAQGKSNKIIAHELGLSIRSVESHRSRLNRKLGDGVAAVVRVAAAAGVI